jgi:hypothetical protein
MAIFPILTKFSSRSKLASSSRARLDRVLTIRAGGAPRLIRSKVQVLICEWGPEKNLVKGKPLKHFGLPAEGHTIFFYDSSWFSAVRPSSRPLGCERARKRRGGPSNSAFEGSGRKMHAVKR